LAGATSSPGKKKTQDQVASEIIDEYGALAGMTATEIFNKWGELYLGGLLKVKPPSQIRSLSNTLRKFSGKFERVGDGGTRDLRYKNKEDPTVEKRLTPSQMRRCEEPIEGGGLCGKTIQVRTSTQPTPHHVLLASLPADSMQPHVRGATCESSKVD
jgi:hypothetical protein